MKCTCNDKIEDNIITEEMPDGFKRVIMFNKAYKCEQPRNPNWHGIGAMKMCFLLVGPNGATQWMISTNWEINPEPRYIDGPLLGLQAWDLGYHSKIPRYDGHSPIGKCEFTGGNCYYVGSSLNAEEHVIPFLKQGPGYIWKVLREEYDRRLT